MAIQRPVCGQASALRKAAVAGEVLAHGISQIYHPLMVSGAIEAQLRGFDGELGLPRLMRPDASADARTGESWETFAPRLVDDIPPRITEADSKLR